MSLLETLSSTIEIQEKLQEAEYKEIMSRPIKERINKGYTLTNLSVEIEFFDYPPNNYCDNLPQPKKHIRCVKITCAQNNSKIREGSQVKLSNKNIESPYPNTFKMEVEQDGISYFILKSGDFDIKYNYLDSENYPKDGWEINVINQDVTYKLLRSAYQKLEYNSHLNEEISNFLEGNVLNIYDDKTVNVSDNKSQNEAISKSLGCSRFHLIQGPPGTGKTFTIAKLTQLLIEDGKSVFVTGPTHTSINNCLNAISKNVRDKSKIVKLGEKHQAEEIVNNENILRVRKLRITDYKNDPKYSKNGIAVGATPYSVCYPGSKKLEGWIFDYAIVDEAAQLSIPLALAVIYSCRKIIFVGDHKQLDPIIHHDSSSTSEKEYFNTSIFERLTDKYPNDITLLNQSYRLNDELINIPNKLFYDNKLTSKRKNEKPFLNFECKKAENYIKSNANIVLIEHHQFDSLGRSEFEANIVCDIIYDLLKNDVSVSEIGVISPYRAQVREIKRVLIEKNVLAESEINNIFIDTVERMQGQEKQYIIYSVSNSNPAEVEDRLDFFYSPNRLNVAITRSNTKTFVIANENIFKVCDKIISSSKNQYLKHCADIFLRFKEMAYNIEVSNDSQEMEEDW